MPSSLRLLSGLSLATLTSLASPLATRAAEPALDRLVGPEAAVVFSLEELPSIRARFNDSGAGRFWKDPEISRFLAPAFAHPVWREFTETVQNETGHTLTELLGFATGDLLFTVPISSMKLAKDDLDADAFLALEVGENEAKIRELIARQEAKQKAESPGYAEKTEDYNGVTLHLIDFTRPDDASAEQAEAPVDEAATESAVAPAEKRTLVWALHEGRWFIATDRALVTGALDALAAGGLSPSLFSAPAYRAVLDRAGGRPDYAMLLDFQALYPRLVSSLEAARDPAQPANPMGVEPLNIVRALGLDALGALSATGAFAADGSSTGDFALTYTEARGLVNLLAYREGPVARPDWVPASWINVSSQNFSLADLWAELERILDRVSPMVAGMALGQVKAFDRQLNIDIKRDLVGNLGPAVLSGISLPAGASTENPPPYDEMEQFFAASLADPAAFERTVEAIKGQFLPPDSEVLQKRDYLGRTLHVFTPPEGMPAEAKGFAYAIADGWLLVGIGSAAPVEAAIQGMAKPEATASFWARPDVRAALDSTPASAFSVQFADLRPLMASLAALAVNAQKLQADQDPEATPFVDASATPSTATFAKYLSYVVTHGERRADGLYFTTTTPPAPAAP